VGWEVVGGEDAAAPRGCGYTLHTQTVCHTTNIIVLFI
jgi:hypothetical protein